MIDQNAQVACVILVLPRDGFYCGVITIHATIDYQEIARRLRQSKKLVNENPELGFDYQTCGVINSLSKQSQDIAQVALMKHLDLVLTRNKEPGNQRIIYGWLCSCK